MSTTITVEDKGQWVVYQLPAQRSSRTLLCACAWIAEYSCWHCPQNRGPGVRFTGVCVLKHEGNLHIDVIGLT